MSEADVSTTGVPTCYRHPGKETYIRCQRCDRPICPDCMRSAAVGFQCVNCIKEGSKATRSGRTAYGGQRSANPHLTSGVLVGINGLIWLMIAATGLRSSPLVDKLGLIPVGRCAVEGGGYYPDVPGRVACLSNPPEPTHWIPGVADGSWWQLFTVMFTHVEIWHIAFNMLALWQLGPMLESAIGRTRFLALYFLSGLAASALIYGASPVHSQTVGASGAIFGLMGALLIVAVKVRGNVQQILYWIGANFVITFVFVRFISWQGHVGGFLGGLAIAAAIVYAPRSRRAMVQWSAMAVLAAAVAAAIVARTAMLT